MRCWVCNQKFHDGQALIPVTNYVVNEKRGDFVPLQADKWICASHLKDLFLQADGEPYRPRGQRQPKS